MVDVSIFQDSTIQRIVFAMISGIGIAMVLAIVVVLTLSSPWRPVIFIGVFAVFLTAIWFWSDRLP